MLEKSLSFNVNVTDDLLFKLSNHIHLKKWKYLLKLCITNAMDVEGIGSVLYTTIWLYLANFCVPFDYAALINLRSFIIYMFIVSSLYLCLSALSGCKCVSIYMHTCAINVTYWVMLLLYRCSYLRSYVRLINVTQKWLVVSENGVIYILISIIRNSGSSGRVYKSSC